MCHALRIGSSPGKKGSSGRTSTLTAAQAIELVEFGFVESKASKSAAFVTRLDGVD